MVRINARNKGFRTVAKGKRLFEAEGYIGCNLEKNGRFTKDKDLFGLWDYLFVRGHAHVFVQFKTNKRGQAWKKPFIEWGHQHASYHIRYEIWNWIDYKGFEITYCTEQEFKGI